MERVGDVFFAADFLAVVFLAAFFFTAFFLATFFFAAFFFTLFFFAAKTDSQVVFEFPTCQSPQFDPACLRAHAAGSVWSMKVSVGSEV